MFGAQPQHFRSIHTEALDALLSARAIADIRHANDLPMCHSVFSRPARSAWAQRSRLDTSTRFRQNFHFDDQDPCRGHLHSGHASVRKSIAKSGGPTDIASAVSVSNPIFRGIRPLAMAHSRWRAFWASISPAPSKPGTVFRMTLRRRPLASSGRP